MYKNPFEKGRLIITFDVKFPGNSEIELKKLPELERLLPAKPKIEIPIEAEEHILVDIDPAQERNRRHGEAYMEEDGSFGSQGGARRVQCANQ